MQTTIAGRYLRSRTGRYARVLRAKVSGRVRNTRDGQPLYRLEHLTPYGKLKSAAEWTEAQLESWGVRWLKHKPREAAIMAAV